MAAPPARLLCWIGLLHPPSQDSVNHTDLSNMTQEGSGEGVLYLSTLLLSSSLCQGLHTTHPPLVLVWALLVAFGGQIGIFDLLPDWLVIVGIFLISHTGRSV